MLVFYNKLTYRIYLNISLLELIFFNKKQLTFELCRCLIVSIILEIFANQILFRSENRDNYENIGKNKIFQFLLEKNYLNKFYFNRKFFKQYIHIFQYLFRYLMLNIEKQQYFLLTILLFILLENSFFFKVKNLILNIFAWPT